MFWEPEKLGKFPDPEHLPLELRRAVQKNTPWSQTGLQWGWQMGLW